MSIAGQFMYINLIRVSTKSVQVSWYTEMNVLMLVVLGIAELLQPVSNVHANGTKRIK